MKISISINEVLRDFINQFAYTYDKYIAETDVTHTDVTNLNLIEFFKFEDINRLNTFLYLEAPLEIFGHADQMSDGLMNNFNNFIMEIKDDEEHSVELVSREIDKSIPSTFFFLSKTGCKINDIRFVTHHEDEWGDNDVLVTANPHALDAKPNGKISVKVRTPYNTDSPADYEIDTLLDFINDSELRTRILTTITTTYEEL
jgi:5'(3')-deoxyribonucleotidase